MNWESWLTAYEMSSLVNARYWRLPITIRYSVGEPRAFPVSRVSLGVGAIGVVMGLASSMFNLDKRSVMYFFYMR